MFPDKKSEDVCLFFRQSKDQYSCSMEEYIVVVPSKGMISQLRSSLTANVLPEISVLHTENTISYINIKDKSIICKVEIVVIPVMFDFAPLRGIREDVVVIADPLYAELDRAKEYVKWIISTRRS
jgi:hypothetical protein